MTFFAYKNRWSSITVKPYDFEEMIEARKSPSVLGVISSIEAGSIYEAEAIAKADFAAGRFAQTHAAVQPEANSGLKSGEAGAASAVKYIIRRVRASGAVHYNTARGGWTLYEREAKRFDSEAAARALLRNRSGEIVQVAA